MKVRKAVRSAGEAGFTIAQMLVTLAVSVVVIAAIYQLVIGQNRLYSKQQELTDVRGTLRTAAEVLAVEIRMASASEGDIFAIATDSIVLRSVQGSGIVCAVDTTGSQYGLTAISGEFFASADDSVMIYATGSSGPDDDTWVMTTVTQVFAAGGGDVPTCSWGAPTEAVVAVDTLNGTALSGVSIGAPLLAFRHIAYSSFQKNNRWWLNRRVSPTATSKKLTGPLRPPSDSGLAFYYYDSAGAPAATAADVRQVEILLRGESLKDVRQVGSAPAAQTDTLRTRVFLRG